MSRLNKYITFNNKSSPSKGLKILLDNDPIVAFVSNVDWSEFTGQDLIDLLNNILPKEYKLQDLTILDKTLVDIKLLDNANLDLSSIGIDDKQVLNITNINYHLCVHPFTNQGCNIY